jgi:hypothetical protein
MYNEILLAINKNKIKMVVMRIIIMELQCKTRTVYDG